MSELSPNVNGIEIDEKKVKLLLSKLIMREKTNLQTRERSDSQMVQMIKKLIEEDVECY